MNELFKVGEAILCQVKAPAGIRYKVDGYPKTGEYQGWYFEGMPMRLEMSGPDQDKISHLMINGKKAMNTDFDFRIESKTVIEMILK